MLIGRYILLYFIFTGATSYSTNHEAIELSSIHIFLFKYIVIQDS